MDITNSSEWGDMSSWVTEILTQNTTGTLTTPIHADQTTSSVKSPSVSGSDPDTSVARLRNGISSDGKIKKRKSRASKRNTTTYIAADPVNFRRMVQQVTGFRNGQEPVAPLLKPEPQRLFNLGQGSWPTLDSSPFMVGGRQQLPQQVVGPIYAAAGSGYAPVMEADGVGGFTFQ